MVMRKCRKLKDGRYPVTIRLTHSKKVKYIFTGYSALEREWNGKYPTYLNNTHGKGTMTHPDGRVETGVWKKGILKKR